jgi:hypothetical protein
VRSTGLTTFPIQHHYSSKLKAFRPCVWIRGQLLNSLTGLRRLWAAPAIGKSPLQIGTDSATPASAFGPGIRPSKWSRSARRWGDMPAAMRWTRRKAGAETRSAEETAHADRLRRARAGAYPLSLCGEIARGLVADSRWGGTITELKPARALPSASHHH